MKKVLMTRLFLTLVLSMGTWSFYSPHVHASCVVNTSTPTYANGTSIREDACDASGARKVTVGSGSSGATATATVAVPTYTEGQTTAPLSLTLFGALRVALENLISGEDQTNNLLMTSGGAARKTQILGTGGIPSTATDATSTTSILPTGKKTFQGIVTCTGTCVQTQKIYGHYANATANGELLCTLTLSDTTNAHASCQVDSSWMYYYVVTTLTSGTTPLAGVFAQY